MNTKVIKSTLERIKQAYDADCNLPASANGSGVLVSATEYALAEMVAAQQAEIEALKEQASELVAHRIDIRYLKEQIARLLEAVPSANVPPRNK